MRELILLRHADAALGAPGQTDRDRPLSIRGGSRADAVGIWLAAGVAPTRILHSPARRALDTALRVQAQLQPAPPLTAAPGVYSASAGELLALVAARAAEEVLLLVGHNPGISELLGVLVGGALAPPRVMHPATTVRLALDATPAPGGARVLAVHNP